VLNLDLVGVFEIVQSGKTVQLRPSEALAERLVAQGLLLTNGVPLPNNPNLKDSLVLSGIPSADEIPIAERYAKRHFLADTILKPGLLNEVDLLKVLREPRIQNSILMFSTGAVPAASNDASSYSAHSWSRDACLAACSLRRAGLVSEAGTILESFATFYAREEQRKRFVSFHAEPGDHGAAQRYGNGGFVPDIRARISDSGELVESNDPWAHTQLDAIGEWLWTTFRLANDGDLDLPELNKRLNQVNSNNSIESIFVAALKFLNGVKYWEQKDHGPWEDIQAELRATSIGICVSAFNEAIKYFDKHGWGSLGVVYPSGDSAARFKEETLLGREMGSISLKYLRIPDQRDAKARECGRVESDSGLALLLYPFTPDLTRQQEDAILRTVYERMGELGFSRRGLNSEGLPDNYVGQNYARDPNQGVHGIWADTTQPGFKPAEWAMFDSLLNGYYARRFIESGATDFEALQKSEKHLRRALLMINPHEDNFTIRSTGRHVTVPQGALVEGYWYDTRGAWRPNHNSPLFMTAACFTLGIERHLEALRLFAETNPELHSPHSN